MGGSDAEEGMPATGVLRQSEVRGDFFCVENGVDHFSNSSIPQHCPLLSFFAFLRFSNDLLLLAFRSLMHEPGRVLDLHTSRRVDFLRR
jgi:hypothetical protein